MTDRTSRDHLATARAGFLGDGTLPQDGVPDTVAASWQRSASAGVDASTYQVSYHEDIEFDSRLAHCARPVLERLFDDLSQVPVTIALSDARARIIDRRDCSTSVGRVLDSVDFNPGFGFEEGGVGTNGIGTVFEAGQAVSVVGEAHFNESLLPFACTGAPVKDPITGRVEGVLDVSQLAETWSPLIHVLVKGAATDIGRLLLADRDRAQRALFEAYARVDSRTPHGVIAVGQSVILNQRAQRLLSSDEQLLVQQHARFLASAGRRRTDELVTDQGRRLRMRVTDVPGADDLGVVLVVSEVSEDSPVPPSQPRRRSPAASAPVSVPGWSPAWQRSGDQIRTGIARLQDVLVVGERGTGRATLATAAFRHVYDDGLVVGLSAATLEQHAEQAVPGEPAGAVLVLVRELQQITGSGVAALVSLRSRLESSMTGPVILAGTLTSDEPSAATVTAALPETFGVSVTLPPLRHRASDIPRLVGDLLADLAPRRRVRLGAAAERALLSYHWPGNLPQLREALSVALTRRPAGEILVEDLPGYCHSRSQRSLGALEASERDTIVDALRRCGGNRVHTADLLGISRSSLYRKLKEFAITEV